METQEKVVVTKFQLFVSMGKTQWGKVQRSEPKNLLLKNKTKFAY